MTEIAKETEYVKLDRINALDSEETLRRVSIEVDSGLVDASFCEASEKMGSREHFLRNMWRDEAWSAMKQETPLHAVAHLNGRQEHFELQASLQEDSTAVVIKFFSFLAINISLVPNDITAFLFHQ